MILHVSRYIRGAPGRLHEAKYVLGLRGCLVDPHLSARYLEARLVACYSPSSWFPFSFKTLSIVSWPSSAGMGPANGQGGSKFPKSQWELLQVVILRMSEECGEIPRDGRAYCPAYTYRGD